jgi:hypothetical protein
MRVYQWAWHVLDTSAGDHHWRLGRASGQLFAAGALKNAIKKNAEACPQPPKNKKAANHLRVASFYFLFHGAPWGEFKKTKNKKFQKQKHEARSKKMLQKKYRPRPPA